MSHPLITPQGPRAGYRIECAKKRQATECGSDHADVTAADTAAGHALGHWNEGAAGAAPAGGGLARAVRFDIGHTFGDALDEAERAAVLESIKAL